MIREMGLAEIFSSPAYGESYTHAKATNTCVRCKGPAKAFRDPLAELEYKISALCQVCQDDCFTGKHLKVVTP
jgi:hypothetical protein